MNRLLSDLGITAGPDADPTTISLPNAMLGFNRSLDGDNQWVANDTGRRMALVRGVVYDQIFKKQVGETEGIDSYLKLKADLYQFVGPPAAAQTSDGQGRVQTYANGRVYW